LVSLFSSLGGEVKKAEKSINKSSEALNKFIAKLEQRFAKLQSRLDISKKIADSQIDSSVDSVSEDIFTAQTIAEQAKAGDFSQVAEPENWLKKTFSSLFAKK
jgi:archaellum component FlaC